MMHSLLIKLLLILNKIDKFAKLINKIKQWVTKRIKKIESKERAKKIVQQIMNNKRK